MRTGARAAATVVAETPRRAAIDSAWRGIGPGVEVLSALPTSYPGHAILTEDRGTVVVRDGCPCGWRGAGLQVHGSLPRAELRGRSSDVAAVGRELWAAS